MPEKKLTQMINEHASYKSYLFWKQSIHGIALPLHNKGNKNKKWKDEKKNKTKQNKTKQRKRSSSKGREIASFELAYSSLVHSNFKTRLKCTNRKELS